MSYYYFAYGSNMNPQRMQDRGLRFVQAMSGALAGYQLLFNKRAADVPGRSYANIGHAPGQVVEGVIYELVDRAEIVKMDPFEGTPRFYSRDIFTVETAQGALPAWVYVANPAMIAHDLRPERWYLDHLLAGEPFLTADYCQQLRQVSCRDAESCLG